MAASQKALLTQRPVPAHTSRSVRRSQVRPICRAPSSAPPCRCAVTASTLWARVHAPMVRPLPLLDRPCSVPHSSDLGLWLG